MISPAAGPAPLAGLQPAQVRLEPEHDALQQQGGVRISRLTHSGPLRVPQPAQQLAALDVDDATGSASPAAAAAMSLRWNSARSGFGQLSFRQPLGHPVLPGRR